MTFPIRVVAIADDGQEPVHGITSLQRTELKMETLGLTLAEGKAIGPLPRYVCRVDISLAYN